MTEEKNPTVKELRDQEALFKGLADSLEKGEATSKEGAEMVGKLHDSFSQFSQMFSRHRMETQSTLLRHRGLIGKNKEEVDQATKELEEAFDELWPRLLTLEDLTSDTSKKTSGHAKEIKNSSNKVAELGEKILGLADLIERKHKSALTRINQVSKVEVKIDEEEAEEFRKELKRLEKLVKDAGKYEYGSQLNVLLAGVPVGFTGQLNFKSGFSVVISPQGIDVSTTGTGGGLGFLTATGAVNNTNTTFTFASAPTLVIVNGATYRNGHGVTISGTTATLDNPAGTGGDVYGLG